MDEWFEIILFFALVGAFIIIRYLMMKKHEREKKEEECRKKAEMKERERKRILAEEKARNVTNIDKDPLLSLDDAERNHAIQEVLNQAKRGSIQAKIRIEKALHSVGAAADAKYFKPQYGRMFSADTDEAYRQLVTLANKNRLLEDPALTQRLIMESGTKQDMFIAAFRSTKPFALVLCTVLGIHMQVSVLLSQHGK